MRKRERERTEKIKSIGINKTKKKNHQIIGFIRFAGDETFQM